MELEKIKKNLLEGAGDVALGTGAAIVSLHMARRMPKYSGWVLLGTGLLGIMIGGKVLKTASIVAASMGAIATLNTIALENGVPSITGFKGTINKIIPQLSGGSTPMLGFGSVEDVNERLLGLGLSEEEIHGTDDLMGLDEDLRGQDDLTGFGSLM